MDIGAAVGGKLGVDANKLQALLLPEPPAGVFDELERLALRLADAMTAVPCDVPDDLFAALRARLSPEQLVELASAIAWEQYRSRFNRAFDVQSQGLAAGAHCLVPPRSPCARK